VANTWRTDVSNPHSGTHRARLEAAWLAADVGEIIGVGLNASGRVVKGAGNTGVIGVLVMSQVRPAGHPVDVLKIAEVTGGTQIAGVAAVAGTSYSITAAGVIAATAAGVPGNLGHTVEIDRFVVDFRTP
jgi:hypothetical protein